jgi:hypothetical protein
VAERMAVERDERLAVLIVNALIKQLRLDK